MTCQVVNKMVRWGKVEEIPLSSKTQLGADWTLYRLCSMHICLSTIVPFWLMCGKVVSITLFETIFRLFETIILQLWSRDQSLPSMYMSSEYICNSKLIRFLSAFLIMSPTLYNCFICVKFTTWLTILEWCRLQNKRSACLF